MSDGKMHTGQPWEPPETELLIHLYAKRRDEFKKKGMKKKLIFEEIAKKIPKRNATACQKKMEQLLRDYRRRLQCHSTTDAKEDPKIVKNLEPYFDLLNRVENGDCLPELQLSGVKEENISCAEMTDEELGRYLSHITTSIQNNNSCLRYPLVRKMLTQLKECVYENIQSLDYCLSKLLEDIQQDKKTLERFRHIEIDDSELPFPASQSRTSADNRTSAIEESIESVNKLPENVTSQALSSNKSGRIEPMTSILELNAVDSETTSVGHLKKSILSPSKYSRFGSASDKNIPSDDRNHPASFEPVTPFPSSVKADESSSTYTCLNEETEMHLKASAEVTLEEARNLSSKDASNLKNQIPDECTSSLNSCKPKDVSLARSCSVPPDAIPTHFTTANLQNNSPSSSIQNFDVTSDTDIDIDEILNLLDVDDNSFRALTSNLAASGSDWTQQEVSDSKALQAGSSAKYMDAKQPHEKMSQEKQVAGNESLQQVSYDHRQLNQYQLLPNNQSGRLVANPNVPAGNSVCPQSQSLLSFYQNVHAHDGFVYVSFEENSRSFRLHISQLLGESKNVVNHAQPNYSNGAATAGISLRGSGLSVSPTSSPLSNKHSKNYDSDVSSTSSNSRKRSKHTKKSVPVKRSKTKASGTQRKASSKTYTARSAVNGINSLPVPHPVYRRGSEETRAYIEQCMSGHQSATHYQGGSYAASNSHQWPSDARQSWDQSGNMMHLHSQPLHHQHSAVGQHKTPHSMPPRSARESARSNVVGGYQADHQGYFNNRRGNAPPGQSSVLPSHNTLITRSYQNPPAYGDAPSAARNSQIPPSAPSNLRHAQTFSNSIAQKNLPNPSKSSKPVAHASLSNPNVSSQVEPNVHTNQTLPQPHKQTTQTHSKQDAFNIQNNQTPLQSTQYKHLTRVASTHVAFSVHTNSASSSNQVSCRSPKVSQLSSVKSCNIPTNSSSFSQMRCNTGNEPNASPPLKQVTPTPLTSVAQSCNIVANISQTNLGLTPPSIPANPSPSHLAAFNTQFSPKCTRIEHDTQQYQNGTCTSHCSTEPTRENSTLFDQIDHDIQQYQNYTGTTHGSSEPTLLQNSTSSDQIDRDTQQYQNYTGTTHNSSEPTLLQNSTLSDQIDHDTQQYLNCKDSGGSSAQTTVSSASHELPRPSTMDTPPPPSVHSPSKNECPSVSCP